MTRRDFPLCQRQIWLFLCGRCLGSGPFPCLLRCCFLWAKRKSAGGFACRWCWWFFVLSFSSRFCIMEPRRFMINFLNYLLAYPNVRTEPQSDIGRNRGKKSWRRWSTMHAISSEPVACMEGGSLFTLWFVAPTTHPYNHKLLFEMCHSHSQEGWMIPLDILIG